MVREALHVDDLMSFSLFGWCVGVFIVLGTTTSCVCLFISGRLS